MAKLTRDCFASEADYNEYLDRLTCEECGELFTADNPCCCDYATHEDGTHEGGVCKSCCGPHSTIWDGKSVTGGTYQRGE